MKVFASLEFELAALEDTEFQNIVDGPLRNLMAMPTYYRASNPSEVWPKPCQGVSICVR